jgi:hypothetical protein
MKYRLQKNADGSYVLSGTVKVGNVRVASVAQIPADQMTHEHLTTTVEGIRDAVKVGMGSALRLQVKGSVRDDS